MLLKQSIQRNEPTNQPQPFSKKFTVFIWIGLTLLAPFVLFIQLVNFAYRVPVLDEVPFVALIAKLHTGGLTLADFWNQTQEHRFVLWRILALAMAKLLGYDVFKESLGSFLTALLTLFVIWRLLQRSLPVQWRGPVMVGCAWLLFSDCQWQNWAWGFQWAWFLVNLQFVIIVLLFTYRPLRLTTFAIAVGLAISATYTVGSGLAVWPAVGLAIILDWRNWPKRYLVIWTLAGVVSYGLYLINYNPNFEPRVRNIPKTYVFDHPFETATFVFNYLGTPIAYWSQSSQGAFWAGAGGLLLVGLAAGWLWKQRGRDEQHQTAWQTAWPWLVIVFFALVNAALIGISRAPVGPDQAFASRLTTVTILFWMGGGVIALIAGRQLWQNWSGKLGQRKIGLVSSILLLGSLAISYGVSSYNSYTNWPVASNYLNEVIPFLYYYKSAPDAILNRLHPNLDLARNMTEILAQYKEGPFAISKEQYWQQVEAQWQDQIKAHNYQPIIYPTQLAQFAYGEVSDLKSEEQVFSFNHFGKDNVYIQYDLSKFYQQQGWTKSSQDTLPVEIESKNAQIVTVYYSSTHALNPGQYKVLGITKIENGQHYFRATVPSNTNFIQLTVGYADVQPTPDQLKLTLYVGKQ